MQTDNNCYVHRRSRRLNEITHMKHETSYLAVVDTEEWGPLSFLLQGPEYTSSMGSLKENSLFLVCASALLRPSESQMDSQDSESCCTRGRGYATEGCRLAPVKGRGT
jgi:hypothetical protein